MTVKKCCLFMMLLFVGMVSAQASGERVVKATVHNYKWEQLRSPYNRVKYNNKEMTFDYSESGQLETVVTRLLGNDELKCEIIETVKFDSKGLLKRRIVYAIQDNDRVAYDTLDISISGSAGSGSVSESGESALDPHYFSNYEFKDTKHLSTMDYFGTKRWCATAVFNWKKNNVSEVVYYDFNHSIIIRHEQIASSDIDVQDDVVDALLFPINHDEMPAYSTENGMLPPDLFGTFPARLPESIDATVFYTWYGYGTEYYEYNDPLLEHWDYSYDVDSEGRVTNVNISYARGDIEPTPQKDITFEYGTPTGIVSVAASPLSTDEGYYSLDGVRHEQLPSQKGIYIHNGKKVVVK